MPNRPRRLQGFDYRGFHSYFLTICTYHRIPAFTDLAFGLKARDHLLQQASLKRFALPAYCFMPDHVHVLARGQHGDANLRSFVLAWKTWTAHEWRKAHPGPLWQSGYFDRVLRDDEPELGVARYIILNPVRAGLVQTPEQYPLVDSPECSLAEILCAADEWRPGW